jgi:hypothetical protein
MSNDQDTTASCSECFAEVRASNQQKHREWHETVIEQAVTAAKKRADEEFQRSLRSSF